MAKLDDELIEVIAAESLIDRAKLVREATLADIGLDSVDVVSIIFAVEEKYGVEIPDGAFASAKNLGDFLDVIEAIVDKKAA
ncbi:MAG: phosphopantetheine-binding protein [Caulobacteraceae bacterium]